MSSLKKTGNTHPLAEKMLDDSNYNRFTEKEFVKMEQELDEITYPSQKKLWEGYYEKD